MIEKGIPQPPAPERWVQDNRLTDEAWRWISRVWSNYPKVQTYEVTINPASVAANTSAEQTFTVAGLTTSDIVFVNKPTTNAGLLVGSPRVSAANTLAIPFGNLTGSPIDPGSEIYKITAVRL